MQWAMKFEGKDGRPAKQSSFLNKINKTILMGHPPKNGQLVQVEHSRQIETYLTNIESKLDCDQDIAPQQKVRAVRLPPSSSPAHRGPGLPTNMSEFIALR